jgi:hypothetical protein
MSLILMGYLDPRLLGEVGDLGLKERTTKYAEEELEEISREV